MTRKAKSTAPATATVDTIPAESASDSRVHDQDFESLAFRALAERRCGARTKRDGKPCQCPVALRPDGTRGKRCKWHGGLSTGPKSEAGKARSAASWRYRWAS